MGQRNRQSEELAAVLGAVLAELNAAKIDYCILRNYEMLPHYTGHDLDVLVAPRDIAQAAAVLEGTFARSGWNLLAETKQRGNHSLYFYYARSPRVQMLTIDLVAELNWGWMPSCDAARILETKINYRGIPTAAPGADAASRLLKTVLRGKLPDEKAWAVIRKYTRTQAALFSEVLGKYVDAGVVKKILESVDTADIESLRRLSGRMRRSVFRRAAILRPAASARELISYLTDRLKNRWKPGLGMTVVLIGPDGIGKTTLCERLAAGIGSLLFRGTITYHGGFNIVPRLNVLLRKLTGIRTNEIDFTQKHSGSNVEPHSFLRSLFYLLYYTPDYLLGRLKLAGHKSRGRLVLFDRYFYDHYFQRRSGNLPHWLIGMFQKAVPVPDAVLVLKADPVAVYRRKPELVQADIRRSVETAERVGELLVAATYVESVITDRGEEIAEDQAARAIFAALQKRNYGHTSIAFSSNTPQHLRKKGALVCE